jgi:Holliday junction resolvase RusA-like endonuclease
MVLSGIPMPPSVNNAYPSSRTGRRFKSKELTSWERQFQVWAYEHYKKVEDIRKQMLTRLPGQYLLIKSHFYFTRQSVITKEGTPKRNGKGGGDTSNRLKVLHDAISKLIGIDDVWFFDLTATKRLCGINMNPQCLVELEWVEAPWMLNPTAPLKH